MGLDASQYILNRKASKTALIDNRVSQILAYVVDCYLKFKSDNVTFTKEEKGKISQEDYFRNILVDEYLRKNKNLISQSSTTDIRFTRESTETYEDALGDKHDDKIDVHITDTALQNSWGQNEDVYYAIECKRITTLSDTTKYVDDIRKFTERNYISTRLPYEGQIAFVENPNISNSDIVKEINNKLEKHTTITTSTSLVFFKTHSTFKGSYLSKHLRNQTKDSFSINHLFFDYTSVVV